MGNSPEARDYVIIEDQKKGYCAWWEAGRTQIKQGSGNRVRSLEFTPTSIQLRIEVEM